jgi:hypothetical protein
MVYHGVLNEIARQCPIEDEATGKPFSRELAMSAYKEWFRGKFHAGTSSEALPDEKLREVTLQIESFAACRMGVAFPVRDDA